MRIGVVFNLEKSSGGSYHQALKTIKILSKIEGLSLKFYNIKQQKNDFFDDKIKIYKTNLLDKIFFLFYKSEILKSFLKKFKITNRFENFFKKEGIDIIYFIGNSRFSIFCNKLDYITYIYEFHHIFRPDLPEYKGWTDFDFRENIILRDVRKAISIIVDTKKKASDLIKYYNCIDSKVNVIPLVSNIIKEENFTKKKLSDQLESFLSEKKEFYFYPAQYWSHKNHVYILESLKILREKFNKKIYFVFTGSKKENFKKITSIISKYNLDKQIYLFNYLKDEELIELYKNSKALVMPSLIGYSSLPLYEAFYFQTPVFYTKNLLDDDLKEFVNEIDINDKMSLVNEILNYSENEKLIHSKSLSAKQFYSENISDSKIINLYEKLFKKIKNLRKIY